MHCFTQYLDEIGKAPLLTREEEVELSRRAQNGDEYARDRMIRSNLKLVVTIAQGYTGHGLDLEDLVAEGNRGLMKAVERFDPTKGAKFSVYSSYWIKQSMRRALSNQSRTVRLPVHVVDKLSQIEQARHAAWGDLGRDPTGAELSEATGIKAKNIRMFEERAQTPVSLDMPIGERQKGSIAEVVPDDSSMSPDESVSLTEMLGQIGGMLDVLDERERHIIRDRFGLEERPVKTLSQIAEGLGVTPERVRQLQEIALKKMRLVLAQKEGRGRKAGAVAVAEEKTASQAA
ncbi:MAG: sigma-70 family RNA polymerase sigma factor [Verrucomicrobiota bacterium]